MFFKHNVLAVYLSLLPCLVLMQCLPTFAQVPDDILNNLKPGHPRLFVQSLQDFQDLKLRIPHDAYLIKCEAVLHQKADDIIKQDTIKYVLVADQGGKLLEVSRTVLRRTYILALMYRLTNDKKYADRAWGDLLAASRFPDWNSWHFLDVAEMTHAFAIGYDWLYDVWTPAQRKIIKQAIVDKGLLHGYLGYTGMESNHVNNWPKTTSNWNQVCNGGLGIGALAIADEEPKLSAFILKNALQLLPNVMTKLAPDGANDEGPGYWAYGTRYNVAIIAAMQSALGTDFGLSDIPGFSKTGLYFLTMGGPKGTTFNYSDCWEDTISAPELFWFATRFKQPLLERYQHAHPQYTPLEMLWYTADTANASNLPENNYYRNVEVATVRTSWNDPNAWFLGFKAGSNQANHSHLDIGDFVMEKNGKRWFVDLSHDDYGLPGYFEAGKNGQRWTYYRMKAEGHNTLVIDPDKNPDQDPLAKTAITRFVEKKDQTFGIMDMTNAYPGKVKSVKRGIGIFEKKQVLVQDEIEADELIHDLYWFAQTPAGIKISKDKKTAILTIQGQQLSVEVLSPAEAGFEVLAAKPLAASAQPVTESANPTIQRLTIHLRNIKKATIVVRFKEMDNNGKIKLKPLALW